MCFCFHFKVTEVETFVETFVESDAESDKDSAPLAVPVSQPPAIVSAWTFDDSPLDTTLDNRLTVEDDTVSVKSIDSTQVKKKRRRSVSGIFSFGSKKKNKESKTLVKNIQHKSMNIVGREADTQIHYKNYQQSDLNDIKKESDTNVHHLKLSPRNKSKSMCWISDDKETIEHQQQPSNSSLHKVVQINTLNNQITSDEKGLSSVELDDLDDISDDKLITDGDVLNNSLQNVPPKVPDIKINSLVNDLDIQTKPLNNDLNSSSDFNSHSLSDVRSDVSGDETCNERIKVKKKKRFLNKLFVNDEQERVENAAKKWKDKTKTSRKKASKHNSISCPHNAKNYDASGNNSLKPTSYISDTVIDSLNNIIQDFEESDSECHVQKPIRLKRYCVA